MLWGRNPGSPHKHQVTVHTEGTLIVSGAHFPAIIKSERKIASTWQTRGTLT
jgi:citrate lyase synthetase